MKRTVLIGIARLGSTRLPGKVLMDLGGHPVIEWVVRAGQSAAGIDEVIIATSDLPQDDAIESWCSSAGVRCFRGSESDVLSRVFFAAVHAGADIVLRATCDCPFLDPHIIADVVRLQKMTGCAYASNIDPRTFADGTDIEAFTWDALKAAHLEADRDIDRECVTTWIQRNRSRFPAEAVICPLPNQHKERYVLDTENDLRFCREIAARWSWEKGPPSYTDILAILDGAPHLRDLNHHHPVNERYHEAIANEPIIPRTYARSQAQFERAHKVIPLAAQTFSKSYMIQFPQPSPLFVTHGQGGIVWDADGGEYVDLVSALLPNILGYRDNDVDQAIRRQLSRGISFSLATEIEAQLAETLCRLIPCAEMVRFGKNGTDATTAAIRLARAYTGRDRVLICGGYHGWQDWSIAGTSRDLGVPAAAKELATHVPFGDFNAAQEAFLHRGYAAIIVEPETNREYLVYLRELAERYGALLIFDEIICGFRLDLGGAQKLYGVTPDLATFGKAIANGMPLSALVGRADIMRKLEPPNPCVFWSGTFGGETLSLAAAIATIDKMERESVIAKLWKTGAHLSGGATDLISRHGLSDVVILSGVMPFVRIAMRDQPNATAAQLWSLFRKEMIASGTLIIGSHNICAAHTPGDIKRVLKSYDHTLAIMRDALDKGDIAQRIGGEAVAPMVRAS